jgi:predicted O-methyltransferase YrrM
MDNITEYIQGFLRYPHPLLEELAREQEARDDVPPHIGIQVGTFLAWLIQVIRAKRCAEFGTALGYSTIFLAGALRQTGGQLTAVESDEGRFLETQRNIHRAGLAKIVRLIHGDAREVIDGLEGPFDLILQDAAKSLYPALLEGCVEKTRPGGIIAADDALFRPMGVREELSTLMDEYNRKVFSHPRLVSTILPIGDGLTISVKR